MICWQCGHPREKHFADLLKIGGCTACLYNVETRIKFWKHDFEDNLSFIERKAKEKKLV